MSPAPLRVWREAWVAIVLQLTLGALLAGLAIWTYDASWWRQGLALVVGYAAFRVLWALGRDIARALLPRTTYERLRARQAAREAERLAPYTEPGDFRLLIRSTGRERFEVARAIRRVSGLDADVVLAMTGSARTHEILVGRSYDSCERAATRLRLVGAEVEILRT